LAFPLTATATAQMDSSFRWNDGDVVHRNMSAQALWAWVPAFAGMTGSSKRPDGFQLSLE
jgi:hypothetical protein